MTIEPKELNNEKQARGGNGNGGGLDELKDFFPTPLAELRRGVFWVDPPRTMPDPIVVGSVQARAAQLRQQDEDLKSEADEIEKKWTDAVAAISTAINTSRLDDATRILAANKDIFSHAVVKTLKHDKVDPKNTNGAKEHILRILDKEKRHLLAEVTHSIFKRKDIHVKEPLLSYLKARVVASSPTIANGKIASAILAIYEDTVGDGVVPAYVNKWIKTQAKIPLDRFTDSIVAGMVDYLLGLSLPFESPEFGAEFDQGQYNQFFALAYENARTRTSGEADPIDAMRTRGAIATWDYSVNLFDDVEEQGVVRENILAAGALDYIFWLGDYMGIFKIVDAVVLRWGSGLVDVTNGPAAAKLYRYFKLRDERATMEERAMLYKRVLNRGDGQLVGKMVVNESFPSLWHKLMAEVAEFIRKSEESRGGVEQVSPAPIYQAVRDLQYNLSDHMTGIAHMQVQEMYGNLQEAIDILRDDEVMDQFSVGRRKNLWTVVERLAKEEFDTSLNVAALRTLAVQGNKVFRWIADYDGTTPIATGLSPVVPGVDTKSLQALLDAAQAWIIAQTEVEGAMDPNMGAGAGDDLETESVSDKTDFSTDDEFKDWNV